MSVRFDRPFVCPDFIGRAEPLEAMRTLLEHAVAGDGGTVLVSGDAGIGKSRLVGALGEAAASAGTLTVTGRCFETDRSVPYAVLRDALEGFIRTRPPAVVDHFLGPFADALAGLVPDLSGGTSESETRDAEALTGEPLDANERKQRLHRAVVGWLECLTRTQPLVVILEDLHWSDDAALEVILALARRAASERMLLVLTFRSDELTADLGRALAALDRERVATEVVLKPLAREDTARMLCAMLEIEAPAPGFIDAIHGMTEGNPFFVEEVLRCMAAAGDVTLGEVPSGEPTEVTRIPRTVREAVVRRLRGLTPDARRMLAYAAVAGRRFDFELLRDALRLDEAELLPLVRDAISAQLVVEETPDRFAFRHALTREALYADLLARERRAIHAELAAALEHVHDRRPVYDSDIGHHFFEAGHWARALTQCRRAGERAAALPAPREAAVHFTRAIEAAARLGIKPDPHLLRARGLARETLGDFDGALADFEAGLEGASGPQESRDLRLEWQLLLDLGSLWTARDYDRTGESFSRALQLARRLDDALALARTLNRVGNWAFNNGRFEEAERHYAEALELFRAAGDRLGVALTLDLMALHAQAVGHAQRSGERFDEAITHFRALDEKRRLASSLAMRAALAPVWFNVVFVPLDFAGEEARRGAGESLDITRRIGWRAGEAYTLVVRSMLGSWQGNYDAALADARAALALTESIEHRQWTTLACAALGLHYLDLLILDEARHWLERALELARELRSGIWPVWAGAFLGLALAARGDVEEAAALVDELHDQGKARFTGHRLLVLAGAELELARGEPARALMRVRDLIAAAETLRPARRSDVPRLALVEGEALAALGDRDAAEQALEDARTGAVAQKARPILWRCDIALGRLHARERRRAQASASYANARSTITALADGITDVALRERFVAAAHGLLPAPRPPTPRLAAKRAYGGLTEREREVAGHVALGRTNRAIARALGVSVRTVDSHVSRALARLDFTSRTQLAAWAERNGLTES